MTEIKARIKDGVRSVLIPLDEYELANVIGMIKRTKNNGDWYHQVLYKLRQSLTLLGIEEVVNNFGDNLTTEDIAEIRGA